MQWDPEQYLQFADERGRPVLDLGTGVRARDPRVVADLGGGAGNPPHELAERWRGADVEGVDDSPEMIQRARTEAGEGVRLTLADVRAWEPARPVDVLVSNATLQWVPDHLPLLDRLAGFLSPRGLLPVQGPGDFRPPLHPPPRELA